MGQRKSRVYDTFRVGEQTMTDITFLQGLTLYIMGGCISNVIILLILDWTDRNGGLTKRFNPTIEQMVWGLIAWPVTAWIFWYNFWKAWFGGKR